MSVTLIAAADVHLGRRPSRLPEALAARARELTPAAAWSALVAETVRRRADALLLAGDVVDTEDDRFRALAVLEPGLRHLLEAGVSVLAVAGNHDVHVLPRLAELLGETAAGRDGGACFRILGADGSWERATVRGREGGVVHVVGRSFVAPQEGSSPLDGAEFERPGDGAAVLGLLHADVDGGSSSRYAPVPRRELESADVDAWLLGHVHVPGAMSGTRPIGYLGSLAGLDASETGARGAWCFRVDGPGRMTGERVLVAPLRWELLEVDAAPLDASGPAELGRALERLVHRALGDRVEALAASLGATRAVGFRVRLVGRSSHDRALRRALATDAPIQELTRTVGDVTAFVESVVTRARPSLDLEALAETSDPPGLLARALLAIRDGDDRGRRLVAEAARRAADAAANAAWNASGDDPGEPEMRALLLDAGYDALGELLAQTAEQESAR